jgi:hypothetical protein
MLAVLAGRSSKCCARRIVGTLVEQKESFRYSNALRISLAHENKKGTFRTNQVSRCRRGEATGRVLRLSRPAADRAKHRLRSTLAMD